MSSAQVARWDYLRSRCASLRTIYRVAPLGGSDSFPPCPAPLLFPREMSSVDRLNYVRLHRSPDSFATATVIPARRIKVATRSASKSPKSSCTPVAKPEMISPHHGRSFIFRDSSRAIVGVFARAAGWSWSKLACIPRSPFRPRTSGRWRWSIWPSCNATPPPNRHAPSLFQRSAPRGYARGDSYPARGALWLGRIGPAH